MGHEFDVVIRGYDRRQVDAYIRELTSSAGKATEPVFRHVFFGYERYQVDERLRVLRSELRGEPVPETRDDDGPDLDAQLAHFFTDHTDRFEVAMRGYDRHQVDRYIELLATTEDGDLPEPTFDVVIRGYNRHQVHAYLREHSGSGPGRPSVP